MANSSMQKLLSCQGLSNLKVSSQLKTSIFQNEIFSWISSEPDPAELLKYLNSKFIQFTALLGKILSSISLG